MADFHWQISSYSPSFRQVFKKVMVLPHCRVQEIIDDDQREAGRIPRTVECELTADLG